MSTISVSGASAMAAIAFVASALGSSPLAAQMRVQPKPLVVVMKGPAGACARRLAGPTIEVVELCLDDDYEACNAQALAVRRFSVYLIIPDCYCPRELFWRERILQANPRGQVQQLGCRIFPTADQLQREHVARLLMATHLALVSALPEHRAALDGNLSAELARLRNNPSLHLQVVTR